MSSENGVGEGGAEGAPPEQLALIRESVRKAKEPRAKPRTWRGAALAERLPVARVLVDKGVLHLDRYFDYAVPADLDADAQPGVRVRVRFGAGRGRVREGRREGGGLIDGFLIERLPESDYSGPLAALAQVVSPERVLSPELLGLARAVADRYAGSLADVLQLAVRRGSVRAVVGTRAAMFAPVQDLGLVALWDDGDDSHSEPHAPQPHARDVLLLRAAQDGCGFLLGGWSCTVEAAQLVESGWARPLVAGREQVRRAAPLVRTVGDLDLARDEAARAARLPTLAWQVVRDALRQGPVLVQVPRRGYVPRTACARCRAAARCRHCSGPLEARDGGALACGWCGRAETGWSCPECGSVRLRAQVVGARRTAEELGRAFPAVPVRTSGREHVLDTVPAAPALVVSTPGAEPVAEGGYAAALLLDGWAMLARPDLRAGEDALRRWIAAAALVRPQEAGGTVVALAEPTLRPVQALVRWDPVGHAVRELAERAELGFPPVSRMAAVSGPRDAVITFLDAVELPAEAEVLGPVPLSVTPAGSPRRTGAPPPGEHWDRALVRVPPGRGAALASALKAAQAARMARGGSGGAGTAEAVRVRIDPPDIG
ncbi:primosome assembly protein PriA [Streptomyces galbus]|uniref:primosomal protein N' family DNA-binding protein n=1 Tax=Streptomyces galbus TaxID=33898 RepID=UPI003EB71CE3